MTSELSTQVVPGAETLVTKKEASSKKHAPSPIVLRSYVQYLQGLCGKDFEQLYGLTHKTDRSLALQHCRYQSVYRIYEAAQRYLGLGVVVAPPVMSVEDWDDWYFVQQARILRAIDPEAWARVRNAIAMDVSRHPGSEQIARELREFTEASLAQAMSGPKARDDAQDPSGNDHPPGKTPRGKSK